jgi:surface protein
VSNVTDLSNVFQGLANFNEDMSLWDTSAVTTTKSAFQGARTFNGDVSQWDTSRVTEMDRTFSGGLASRALRASELQRVCACAARVAASHPILAAHQLLRMFLRRR